jgi:hypothetical protein
MPLSCVVIPQKGEGWLWTVTRLSVATVVVFVVRGHASFIIRSFGCHIAWHLDGGLSDALQIPAGFRSFLQIPVPFQWNLPAKFSLQPRNFVIPVFRPEQSPECTGTEWHWNSVTGMKTKNCQIWQVLMKIAIK